MSRFHAFAVLLAALLAFPRAGTAVPVTASYDGTVTDHVVGFAPQITTDLPLGTDVSWSFTFDDAFLALDLSGVFTAPPQSVSGAATIGSSSYALTGMNLFSVTYDLATSNILSYRYQVTGTGPTLAGGASFFGLWLSFDPSLNLSDPYVGFAYTFPNSEVYGYGVTSGDYRLERNATVPEPSSLALFGAALAMLAWAARRRRTTAHL